MEEYYEVLKDNVVMDSDKNKYQTGDIIVLDENRTNELLDTIANYEADGAIRSNQGPRPPKFETAKPKVTG